MRRCGTSNIPMRLRSLRWTSSWSHNSLSGTQMSTFELCMRHNVFQRRRVGALSGDYRGLEPDLHL